MAVRMWTVKIRPVCDIQNRIVHQPVGVGLIYMQIGLLGSQVQPQGCAQEKNQRTEQQSCFPFHGIPLPCRLSGGLSGDHPSKKELGCLPESG